MNSIPTTLLQSIEKNCKKNETYLLAISGGLDSMVLLHLLHALQYKISVAHINYQLRQNDSDLDAALVKQTCEQLQVPFFYKEIDTKLMIQTSGGGVQEVAREIRYAFFKEIITTNKIDCLLTAHHANDNIETVLLNMARGTGLQGLTGIPQQSVLFGIKVIRPFLDIKKIALEKYAADNGCIFRKDSSNNKADYTRNAIRLHAIPAMQNADERFINSMMHNIEHWKISNTIYQTAINKKINSITHIQNGALYIHCNGLQKLKNEAHWLFEILQSKGFSYAQCIEAQKLLTAPNGKLVHTKEYRLIKQNNHLILTSVHTKNNNIIVIEEKDGQIETNNFALTLHTIQNKESNITIEKKILKNKTIEFVDAKNITFPLTLRIWEEGDYFYPLGMQKKKKIAKFLKDEKVQQLQKEDTWVLETNGKIIALLGHRIDNRVCLTSKSKSVLKIEWQKK